VKVLSLRAQGRSWAAIAQELGIGEGTVRRAAQASAKIPSEAAPASGLLSVPADASFQLPEASVSGVEGGTS
jgi:hypothetical protein